MRFTSGIWVKINPQNLPVSTDNCFKANNSSFSLQFFSLTMSELSEDVGFFLPQGSNRSSSNGRIHCSLNINTESGRLSTRRPNLQVLLYFVNILIIDLLIKGLVF
jgi:hypothetical protein